MTETDEERYKSLYPSYAGHDDKTGLIYLSNAKRDLARHEFEVIGELHGVKSEAHRERILTKWAKRNGPYLSVYFIRMGQTEAIKIGMAWNGIQRLLDLQVGSPVKLHLIGFMNFTDESEMKIAEVRAHSIARKHCMRKLLGEWFQLNHTQAKAAFDELFNAVRPNVIGKWWKK